MSGNMDVSTLGVVVTSSGIKDASTQLDVLGTSATKTERKVVSLTASIEKLSAIQRTATGNATAYMTALQGASTSIGGSTQGTLGLETATSMLAKSIVGMSASLHSLTPATSKSTASIVAHTAAMQDAHAMARGLSGGLGALWLTYGNIIPMVAGVALSKGFMDAAKSGSEFAYQLKFVQGLGEETAATMDKVSASILSMAKGSMFSPVEMASGMRVLSQAGLDAANALKVLPQAMDLAVVGEMSMEKASITLVGVMNAFKLTVADVPHVGDVFAKAAAVSQTSVEAMTESMKSASVVGSQYNVSMEDAATALTLLAKVNITGSAAGTALKNMLKEMYAPGKQASDLMKNLGLDVANATGELRPMADVIFDLKKKLQEFDNISQTKILQRLFGERGAKEAVAMLSQTREEWDKLQGSIANSDGFMRRTTALLEDTVKGKWIQAVNTFKAQMVQAFEVMAPHLEKMAEGLQSMFSDESFTTGLKKILGGMASLLEILVSLTPVLIKAAEAWLIYKSAMIGAAVWTAATIAVTEFSAAMLAMSGAMGPTVTGMVGVRGVVASLPALLGAIPTPMTIIAGLLAAGATAWFIWGDSASRAGDKAFDSASRAEALLEKSRNRAKYGVGDLGSARQELEKAENLLNLRVEGRSKGTALSDARSSVDKWTEIVNTLEMEAQKASGASSTLSNAVSGKTGNRKSGEVMGIDKGAITDAYMSELAKIKSATETAKIDLKSAEETLQGLYKQGLIGDVTLIEQKRNAEEQFHKTAIANLEKMLEVASPEKKKALHQEIENEEKRHLADIDALNSKATSDLATYYSKLESENKATSVAGFKAKGEYVKAFLAEQEAQYDLERKQINNSIDSAIAPEHVEALRKRLQTITDMFEAGKASAFFKEIDTSAQATIREIEDGVTSLQAQTTDGSIINKLFAADKLDELYRTKLPQLFNILSQEELIKLSEADRKAYETRMVSYNKFLKHQRDVYKDFIDEVDKVGSEGFRALFDKTEGSWKSFVNKLKDSFKTYLIDEIYKMFARPFVMNILANIAGAAGATGLQGSLQQAGGSGVGFSNLPMSSIGNTASSIGNLVGSSSLSAYGTGFTAAQGGVDLSAAVQAYTKAGGEYVAVGKSLAAGAEAGEGLLGTVSAAMPYIGAAIMIANAVGLFDGGGPVGRTSRFERGFGEGSNGSSSFMNNFRFSDNEMMSTLVSFDKQLQTSEAAAIKNLHLTAEQIAKVNEELNKSVENVYNFGTEHTDWMQSTADEEIAAVRLQAMATALGKSVAEIAAAMDPMFGALVNAGKLIGLTADELVRVAGSSANMQAMTGAISSYYQNYFSQTEKQAKATDELTKAFSDLGFTLPATKEAFRKLVEGLDLTTEGGAKAFTGLMNLQGAFSEFAANSLTVYEKLKAAGQVALDNVGKAFAVLQKAISTERDKATTAHETALEKLNTQIKTVNDSLSEMSSLSKSLRSTASGMSQIGSEGSARAEAQAQIATALAIAKASGVLPKEETLQDALSVVSKPSEGLFSSLTDYQRDFQLTANSITDLADIADSQYTVADRQLKVLEEQLKQENLSYKDEMKRFDAILAEAQAQVDAINGVTVAVMSVADALANFAAMLNVAKANPTVKGGTATSAIENAYKTALNRPSDAAGLQYWQQQIVSGNSTVDEVVANISNSREAQIQNAYESILGRSADTGGMDYWFNSGLSVDQIAANINASAEKAAMPKFASGGIHGGGWRMVGENGPEVEYTGPSTIINNANTKKMFDQSEVADEVRQLREDLRAANTAIAQNTSQTSKWLQRWDGDGMPEVRVIV